MIVLHPTGEKHIGHLLGVEHKGASGFSLNERSDGGVALPEGAELIRFFCIDCGEELAEYADYTVSVEEPYEDPHPSDNVQW